MDPDPLLSMIILGRARYEPARCRDYVQWAVGTMMGGLDSPNLRILAGLMPPYYRPEIESRFDKAVSELGLQPPSPAEAALEYVTLWTEVILATVNDQVSLVQQLVHVYEFVDSLDADQGDLITYDYDRWMWFDHDADVIAQGDPTRYTAFLPADDEAIDEELANLRKWLAEQHPGERAELAAE